MVTVLCTRPSATKIASAVRLQPCLQRSAESIAHNPTAAKCVEGHGDVRFVLAGLAWCRRQTREQLNMHSRIHTSLTTWHGRHARLMCSQAAARQWSLHTMDINGYTSRGPLHSMVVHAVVQWLPSLCRMCRPRTIARSTSLSACSACVVRGRYFRLSRASRGFKESSSASETDSGCTLADQVAEGRSAAVFIRML